MQYTREIDLLDGETIALRRRQQEISIQYYIIYRFVTIALSLIIEVKVVPKRKGGLLYTTPLSVKRVLNSGLLSTSLPRQQRVLELLDSASQAEQDKSKLRRQNIGRFQENDPNIVAHRFIQASIQLREIQREALTAIFRGRSQILVVTLTGISKSLLFILLALILGKIGLIVVFTLNLAQRDSILYTYKEYPSLYTVFPAVEDGDQKKLSSLIEASLVLVTLEVSVSRAFFEFYYREDSKGRLYQFVFDKCYTILEAQGPTSNRLEYRKAILELKDYYIFDQPQLLLTATLPPVQQKILLDIYRQNDTTTTII